MPHGTLIPLTHIPESKETAIQKIDSEIQSLTERLHLLKSQRNQLSITYDLPVEILSRIFVTVKAQCKDSKISQDSFFRSWFCVMHVSQHWRKVALGCSELWCGIDHQPAGAIPLFLEHTRGRPLSVDASSRTWVRCPEQLVSDIFAQFPRIRTLHIAISRAGDSIDALPYLIGAQASNLKHLTVCGNGRSVPDNIFHDSTTPELTNLTLVRCRFNLTNSLLMKDLTTLEVDHCKGASVTGWIAILQELPRLTRLKLDSSFDNDDEHEDDDDDDEDTVVTLYHLSSLEICGGLFEYDIIFLTRLAFPSQTSITFNSSYITPPPGWQSKGTIPALLLFLRIHRMCRLDISQMEITNIMVESDGHNGLKVIASRSGPNHLDYIKVSIQESHWDSPVCEGIIMEEIALLPVSSVTSFHFECPLDDSFAIQSLSAGFPNLQHISCSEAASFFLLTALGGSTEDVPKSWSIGEGVLNLDDIPSPDSFQNHLLLPSLKSLQLNFEYEPYEVSHELLYVLCMRRAEGFPLEKIDLTGTQFYHDEEDAFFFSKLECLVDIVIRG